MADLWEDLPRTCKLLEERYASLFPGSLKTPALWKEVFTHPSYAHEHPAAGGEFERLEFLGDALLYAATSLILFRRHPEYAEDALSFLRTTIVRRETLAGFAEKHRFSEWLRLGKAAQAMGDQGLQTILADLAEAFLAAYFLEFGWDAFLRFVEQEFVREPVRLEEARMLWDPKSLLQELLARRREPPPEYEVRDREGNQTRVLLRTGNLSFEGEGRNRKEAEFAAARKALRYLEEQGSSSLKGRRKDPHHDLENR